MTVDSRRKEEHLKTGEWGEDQAARLLKRKKYKIIGRRVKVGHRDEIDIVARTGKILVFVEVKTRKTEAFGRPVSAVDGKKRHLMSRAAVRYLKSIRQPGVCFRFDVVEVVGAVGDKHPVIRHIENAFTLDRRYSLPC
jgi:putative endonuclease